MHTVSSIDSLDALLADTLRYVPEVGDDLQALVESMRAAAALNLQGDRRLMGIDITNTHTNLTNVIAMRRLGIDTPDVTAAARDADLLVRDMTRRARGLLAHRAQSVAIHAAVAKTRVEDDPHDVTDTLRFITASNAPAPSDGPGVVVPLASSLGVDDPHAYGRIVGRMVAADLDTTLPAAPRGAAVLPVGSFARFQPGQSFLIHHQGAGFLDRFTPPPASPTPTHTTTLIDPVDEVTVHGPAVLSIAQPDDQGVLAPLHQSLTFLESIDREGIPEGKLNYAGRSPIGMAFGAYLFFLGFSATNIIPTLEANPQDPGAWAGLISLGAVFAVLLPFLLRSLWKRSKIWNQSYAKVQALLDQRPAPVADRSITDLLARLCARHPTFRHSLNTRNERFQHPLVPLVHLGEDGTIPSGMLTMPRALSTMVEEGDGWNALPASRVKALHAHDIAVMHPLLALPSPAPLDTTVVSLEGARRASAVL